MIKNIVIPPAQRQIFAFVLSFTMIFLMPLCTEGSNEAQKILKENGVSGGFIVHVGCGDGSLSVKLKGGEGYSLHAIDMDPDSIEKARELMSSFDHHGLMAAATFDGENLPYIDNMVNFLYCSKRYSLRDDEIQRVLTPLGKAIVKEKGKERVITKAWPKSYDEWNHYLRNPDNNAVSTDTAIKPPLMHLQWKGSPKFSRHHDKSVTHMAGLVSAKGRIFYIIDNGPRASVLWPANFQLIARDAFNGVVLWQKSIEQWVNHLGYGVKKGPAVLPRRLVAIDESVYTTLGVFEPVSKLDARSGELVLRYKGTEKTEEILVQDGVMYLVINPAVSRDPSVKGDMRVGPFLRMKPKFVMAVNESDGEILWQQELPWIAPNTLGVGKNIYVCDGPKIHAFDKKTGKRLWKSKDLPWRKNMPTYFSPTLVVSPGGILYAGGENFKEHAGSKGLMTCLNERDGSLKWQAPHLPSGYQSPQDIFVINGRAWCGSLNSKPGEFDKKYPEVAPSTGAFLGYNIESGAPDKSVAGNDDSYWFHHRCHRSKATENYFLTSRTGIEMVDTKTGEWDLNHWVRGACLYGLMPANGLIYAPPHPCACYPEAKLAGFNALSGPRVSGKNTSKLSTSERLLKGPDYAKLLSGTPAKEHDWPTYRGNAARSGSVSKTVTTDLAPQWTLNLGGELSQPVVAGGKVYVAAHNKHSIVAIDQNSGKRAWTFIAGGRIDSPPTYYKGRILFGSKDGYVYTLNAVNGQLVWRFRAAPYDQRHMVYEQLESLWPVHGSVLIRNDVAYVTAGRSLFLEGGMFLHRLDPLSGKVLSTEKMDRTDPFMKPNDPARKNSKNKITGDITDHINVLSMPVGSSDILSSEGDTIFMRSQPFNLQGKRTRTKQKAFYEQKGSDSHLYAANGFLDGSWWHRSFWQYGTATLGGHGYGLTGKKAPSGKIMVLDDKNLYVYGRENRLWGWTVPTEYRLFSVERSMPLGKQPYKKDRKTGKYMVFPRGPKKGQKMPYGLRPLLNRWSVPIPVLVRALVKAGDSIFAAGPADTVNEYEAERALRKDSGEEKTLAALKNQADMYAGKEGSILWMASAKEGKKIKEMKLDVLPVFDGMVAAGGKLYLSSVDGKVVCLGAQ